MGVPICPVGPRPLMRGVRRSGSRARHGGSLPPDTARARYPGPHAPDLHGACERISHHYSHGTRFLQDCDTLALAASYHAYAATRQCVTSPLWGAADQEMTVGAIDAALDAAKLAGVRSILALRGYTQAGFDTWQSCAEGPGLEHAG
jgi:hypothetical protein